jgi:putative acyl-CoA dehydrogenase
MGGPTHEVTNQPPPLEDYNLFEQDRPLVEAVRREGAAWAEPDLAALGKLAGTAEVLRLGEEANRHPPVLRTHGTGTASTRSSSSRRGIG